MTLYVLRHGVAEDAAPGQQDGERRLTEAGERKLRRILARAAAAGVAPEAILTSPYERARRTAQIAIEELKHSERVVATSNLLPYADVVDAWNELRDYAELREVLVAGHNPQLSRLVCFAIGAPGAAVELKKGALAAIELHSTGPQPRGTLRWLLTAKTAG